MNDAVWQRCKKGAKLKKFELPAIFFKNTENIPRRVESGGLGRVSDPSEASRTPTFNLVGFARYRCTR